MKRFLKYCRYSGIWMGIVVNPFHWEFRIVQNQKDNFITMGPFWIRLIIDDGSW